MRVGCLGNWQGLPHDAKSSCKIPNEYGLLETFAVVYGCGPLLVCHVIYTMYHSNLIGWCKSLNSTSPLAIWTPLIAQKCRPIVYVISTV